MAWNNKPRLYGIKNSNRDYSNPDTWGKNQFNSSFPVALACYLHDKGMKAVYLKADRKLKPCTDHIGIGELFKLDPLGNDIFFSFESQYMPFQKFVIGSIPRNDVVIQNLVDNSCVCSLEIKLTALPDNSTAMLSDNKFGAEIVIRPDTIIYLACSIIESFSNSRDGLSKFLGVAENEIDDWTEAKYVIPHVEKIRECIANIVDEKNDTQKPIVMEPVWKTNGKSPQLADNCLDVFVWSNFALLNLFLPEKGKVVRTITRHTRSMIWLYKMLLDYCNNGQFNGEAIIDELSYNTKNDKAFSTNGSRTHALMDCDELHSPRILKAEIKNIILGGGQLLLSPERRFDAIIYNSPDLFK